MSQVTIKGHTFAFSKIDGRVTITFEGNHKEIIEMEYCQSDFLHYFSKDYATNLEIHLQKCFPDFQLEDERKYFKILPKGSAIP